MPCRSCLCREICHSRSTVKRIYTFFLFVCVPCSHVAITILSHGNLLYIATWYIEMRYVLILRRLCIVVSIFRWREPLSFFMCLAIQGPNHSRTYSLLYSWYSELIFLPQPKKWFQCFPAWFLYLSLNLYHCEIIDMLARILAKYVLSMWTWHLTTQWYQSRAPWHNGVQSGGPCALVTHSDHC